MVMTALWVYLLGLCYSCIKDNPAGNVPLLPVVPTAMVMSIFCCANHPRSLSIAVGWCRLYTTSKSARCWLVFQCITCVFSVPLDISWIYIYICKYIYIWYTYTRILWFWYIPQATNMSYLLTFVKDMMQVNIVNIACTMHAAQMCHSPQL